MRHDDTRPIVGTFIADNDDRPTRMPRTSNSTFDTEFCFRCNWANLIRFPLICTYHSSLNITEHQKRKKNWVNERKWKRTNPIVLINLDRRNLEQGSQSVSQVLTNRPIITVTFGCYLLCLYMQTKLINYLETNGFIRPPISLVILLHSL